MMIDTTLAFAADLLAVIVQYRAFPTEENPDGTVLFSVGTSLGLTRKDSSPLLAFAKRAKADFAGGRGFGDKREIFFSAALDDVITLATSVIYWAERSPGSRLVTSHRFVRGTGHATPRIGCSEYSNRPLLVEFFAKPPRAQDGLRALLTRLGGEIESIHVHQGLGHAQVRVSHEYAEEICKHPLVRSVDVVAALSRSPLRNPARSVAQTA